jgi:hypothetical protein
MDTFKKMNPYFRGLTLATVPGCFLILTSLFPLILGVEVIGTVLASIGGLSIIFMPMAGTQKR